MTRLVPLALAVVMAGALSSTSAEDTDGKTIDLFNGKDLTGWTTFLDPKDKGKTKPEEVWSVKDGILICTGQPYGYILTEKDHSDYKLEVEWMWPESKVKVRRNSGVFVHVSGPDKIWPRGVEAQLFSGSAGEFWLVDGFKLEVDKSRQDPKSARHFYRIDKSTPVEKPIGEWNKYEITCKGDTITLVVNGKKANMGTKADRTKGKILLQSEGAPIHFRNIKLTPLKK
jgi:hypothetical protein